MMNSNQYELDVFESKLGWMGVLRRESVIGRLRFGFKTKSDVIQDFEGLECKFRLCECPNNLWQARLLAYSESKVVSFDDFELDTGWMTEFQKTVLQRCRELSYGSTVSYKELATESGSPKAARAVGTAMKLNRIPIIIPCHRVISSAGIGGYSASSGVNTKRHLIEMEQVAIGVNPTERLLF